MGLIVLDILLVMIRLNLFYSSGLAYSLSFTEMLPARIKVNKMLLHPELPHRQDVQRSIKKTPGNETGGLVF